MGILLTYPSEEEGHPLPTHGDYYMSPWLLEGWYSSRHEHRVTLSILSLSLNLSICLSVPGDAAFLARIVIIKLTRRRNEEIGKGGIGGEGLERERESLN